MDNILYKFAQQQWKLAVYEFIDDPVSYTLDLNNENPNYDMDYDKQICITYRNLKVIGDMLGYNFWGYVKENCSHNNTSDLKKILKENMLL